MNDDINAMKAFAICAINTTTTNLFYLLNDISDTLSLTILHEKCSAL